MLSQPEHVNVRGPAQERPALRGESHQVTTSVAFENAALDEARALELIHGTGHAAGLEDDP